MVGVPSPLPDGDEEDALVMTGRHFAVGDDDAELVAVLDDDDVDGSCSSCKSFMADPDDPPKMYIELECTTETWESLGIGDVPSVTNVDHVRVSKSNVCVSDKCRVPS